MTLHYLVDTDWAIHYLHGHAGIIARLEELQDEGLGLSVISLAELYEGIYYSRDAHSNEQALRGFLAGIRLIGIDEETCQIFGRERGRLRAAGELVGDFDLLIGATALRHHLTLLTNNRRHFERIAGLPLVSL
jgi:tRNA(fMet)-specific endonuclease VapC